MNINLDKYFWEHKYKNFQTGWDLGSISEPLKKYIDQLKNKNIRILIPGAGNGYEAEYLLKKGFKNVTVLDIAKVPLDNLKRRIQDLNDVNCIQQDFFKHQGLYDLILEQTFFCALKPMLREKYIDKMHELLGSKGKLVGVLFNIEFDKEGPPFGGNIIEYKKLFEKHFNMHTIAPCYNSVKPRDGNELFVIFEKNTLYG